MKREDLLNLAKSYIPSEDNIDSDDFENDLMFQCYCEAFNDLFDSFGSAVEERRVMKLFLASYVLSGKQPMKPFYVAGQA